MEKKSVKYYIRHFTPAWFTVVMGTGIISTLFANFPYGNTTAPMKALSAVFFFLNLAVFALFTSISALRYLLFRDVWPSMLRHPESLFLGAFPMGGVTLVNTAISLIHGAYGFGGASFVYVVWAFWWLDVAVSALCCWGLVHVMATRQEHTLKSMSVSWLFPVATLVVSSSAGGLLAQALQPFSPAHALLTAAFAVFLLSIGLTLSSTVLAVYFYRLVVLGHPQGGAIVAAFVPLGPAGQAGFSVLLIGESFRALLPVAGSAGLFLGDAAVGRTVYAVCVCAGFVLWSLATMWLAYALLGFYHVLRRTRVAFGLTFWGMIFPNGVYANLTIALGRAFDGARFFRVWGAVYACFTLALWACVFARTLVALRAGTLFEIGRAHV